MCLFGPDHCYKCHGKEEPEEETLSALGWMLTDDRYVVEALGASTPEELLKVYERYLADIQMALGSSLVGLGLSVEGGAAWYLPFGHRQPFEPWR